MPTGSVGGGDGDMDMCVDMDGDGDERKPDKAAGDMREVEQGVACEE